MVWIEFAICSALILISGSRLARAGDVLAEQTGMGRTWIGVILLATVTSLPELATGMSAVTVADVPDIAVGDVLGSCVFNLMLIGLIDVFYRPAPILSRVDSGQILSAGFGTVLIGVAAWGLVAGTQSTLSWPLWVGPSSLLILALYLIVVRLVFRFERTRMAAAREREPAARERGAPLRAVYRQVAFHGSVIVGAGIWLPFIGGRVAEATGLGGTVVGNLFVAASTSLPEIVTSFAALRIGAPDLAVANLFGSNLFNIAILSLDDVAYVKGPLLSHVSASHLFSAVTALMMTGVAVAGLIYRAQKKAWATMSWDGMALLALYLLNAYMLVLLGRAGE